MREYLQIACMAAGGILGAIGGTGFKPARRYILPFVLGGLAFWAGMDWWRCLILWAGLTGAFCLGYGEQKSYLIKFLVGCAYVVPTLALGFTLWQIITPLVFISMFGLSNWGKTSSSFKWKIVEFLTFTLVGATVASTF